MKYSRLKHVLPVVLVEALLLVSSSVALAQVTREQLKAAGAKLETPRALYSRMSDKQRKMLSGGAANFFHVVNNWSDLAERVLANPHPKLASRSGAIPDIVTTTGPVHVSNPATDFVYDPMSGFTQSETSPAWCGPNNIAVAFNDSGSYWESGFASGFSHLSFSGFSNSTNQGLSYTDNGYLPPATVTTAFDFLEGDPVMACAGASTFYNSNIYFYVDTSFNAWSAVSVSTSTDGGASFGPPVAAISKSAFTHFLDKDNMAVDPTIPSHIAVTYTDFDFSGTSAACGSFFREGIEMAFSTDGGVTWSGPIDVYDACFVGPNFPTVQDSQIAFSPVSKTGAVQVNVSFELYSFGVPTGRQIEFASAPSLGSAFGAAVPVQNVTPVGNGFELQGGFRDFLDLGEMAVDHSGIFGKNGNIYIVYQDASDFVKCFPADCYGYSDVMFTKSTDGGATWSAPVEVNTNAEPSGLGVDSYQPGVAVDNTVGIGFGNGEIGVCWYDRRADPNNYKVGRFCGHSATGAAGTWTNSNVGGSTFEPIHAVDLLINLLYLGDYDQVASDSLKTTRGFVGSFQKVVPVGGPVPNLEPNPDVFARNFN
jgi:hypothetical protein